MADQNSRQDKNKVNALLAHSGTAGTAETIRVVADANGNLMVNVAAGEVIAVSAGTITAGTINTGTVNAGTIDVLKAGTITEILNGSIVVTAGTVTTAASDIPGGTLDLISSLATGSIAVTAGTVNVTAFGADIPGGTIDALSALPDLPGGTVDVVTSVSNVAGGTVKLDSRSAQNILTYGTTFAGTAAAYGTLVGSAVVGAGTSLWVNDVSIVNTAGTVGGLVGFGTALNGTSVLVKGKFGAQGGIQKSFPKAVNAGMTNQDLVCYVDGAGTIDVCISYFISA